VKNDGAAKATAAKGPQIVATSAILSQNFMLPQWPVLQLAEWLS
jgi:hypothetical protein